MNSLFLLELFQKYWCYVTTFCCFNLLVFLAQLLT